MSGINLPHSGSNSNLNTLRLPLQDHTNRISSVNNSKENVKRARGSAIGFRTPSRVVKKLKRDGTPRPFTPKANMGTQVTSSGRLDEDLRNNMLTTSKMAECTTNAKPNDRAIFRTNAEITLESIIGQCLLNDNPCKTAVPSLLLDIDQVVKDLKASTNQSTTRASLQPKIQSLDRYSLDGLVGMSATASEPEAEEPGYARETKEERKRGSLSLSVPQIPEVDSRAEENIQPEDMNAKNVSGTGSPAENESKENPLVLEVEGIQTKRPGCDDGLSDERDTVSALQTRQRSHHSTSLKCRRRAKKGKNISSRPVDSLPIRIDKHTMTLMPLRIRIDKTTFTVVPSTRPMYRTPFRSKSVMKNVSPNKKALPHNENSKPGILRRDHHASPDKSNGVMHPRPKLDDSSELLLATMNPGNSSTTVAPVYGLENAENTDTETGMCIKSLSPDKTQSGSQPQGKDEKHETNPTSDQNPVHQVLSVQNKKLGCGGGLQEDKDKGGGEEKEGNRLPQSVERGIESLLIRIDKHTMTLLPPRIRIDKKTFKVIRGTRPKRRTARTSIQYKNEKRNDCTYQVGDTIQRTSPDFAIGKILWVFDEDSPPSYAVAWNSDSTSSLASNQACPISMKKEDFIAASSWQSHDSISIIDHFKPKLSSTILSFISIKSQLNQKPDKKSNHQRSIRFSSSVSVLEYNPESAPSVFAFPNIDILPLAEVLRQLRARGIAARNKSVSLRAGRSCPKTIHFGRWRRTLLRHVVREYESDLADQDGVTDLLVAGCGRSSSSEDMDVEALTRMRCLKVIIRACQGRLERVCKAEDGVRARERLEDVVLRECKRETSSFKEGLRGGGAEGGWGGLGGVGGGDAIFADPGGYVQGRASYSEEDFDFMSLEEVEKVVQHLGLKPYIEKVKRSGFGSYTDRSKRRSRRISLGAPKVEVNSDEIEVATRLKLKALKLTDMVQKCEEHGIPIPTEGRGRRRAPFEDALRSVVVKEVLEEKEAKARCKELVALVKKAAREKRKRDLCELIMSIGKDVEEDPGQKHGNKVEAIHRYFDAIVHTVLQARGRTL